MRRKSMNLAPPKNPQAWGIENSLVQNCMGIFWRCKVHGFSWNWIFASRFRPWPIREAEIPLKPNLEGNSAPAHFQSKIQQEIHKWCTLLFISTWFKWQLLRHSPNVNIKMTIASVIYGSILFIIKSLTSKRS